ncbi:NAD(P)-dependent alcohol dehydrogenase [Pontibacter diazotrophicus]|uniref:NAD(P)-dependent alcohol dehydrogenase n=1 Tax=Pontibacter diazotrophicus TaxID=1400979 RepID=A0A3D8L6V6_9BACT|nr:NAD(P)-dependent alcohol dehydrogenase [Pontibacter diazotrophicus]RDV13121.1 NAD(P)-dependent alcohol dehydrogenase [Pontibacter diazotrophicus]
MKAIYYEKYGEADVLQYGEQPTPEVKEDQLLVRVHASSVNPVDWKVRSGHLLPVSGLNFPKIPGHDMAGEVVEVGQDVTTFKPGDRVFGMLDTGLGGAAAEYAVISEKAAVLMPENLNYVQAAAVPLTALTALQALRDKGELAQGERVLINGASSGVGSFAVQIAKALGAGEVTGVCSTDHIDLVKSLGADRVVDYTEEDFTEKKDCYNIIFDAVAKSTYLDSKDSLCQNGRYVTTVPNPKDIALGYALSVFSDKKLRLLVADEKGEDLELIRAWIETGKVWPVIDKEFPLREAAEAHRYSEGGHAAGKIVLVVE